MNRLWERVAIMKMLYLTLKDCRTVGVKVSANKDADIIKLAMRKVESSEVNVAAKRLADQRPETLSGRTDPIFKVKYCHHTRPSPRGPRVFKFLPDTRFVTGSSECLVYYWNVVSGEVMQKLPGHKSDITSIARVRGGKCQTVGNQIMENPEGDSLASRSKSFKKTTPKYSINLSLEQRFSDMSLVAHSLLVSMRTKVFLQSAGTLVNKMWLWREDLELSKDMIYKLVTQLTISWRACE